MFLPPSPPLFPLHPHALLLPSSATLRGGACLSAMAVCVQEPEPLLDPARDVGVERRTAHILDVRRVLHARPQPRGAGREAFSQRLHMGIPLGEITGILRQRRLRGRCAGRAQRHPKEAAALAQSIAGTGSEGRRPRGFVGTHGKARYPVASYPWTGKTAHAPGAAPCVSSTP